MQEDEVEIAEQCDVSFCNDADENEAEVSNPHKESVFDEIVR